jgi:SAM-dependent methyltransferase
LLELRGQGFRNLTGADAFIPDTIRYPNGVTIHKRQLEDLDGTFDFIMLHHSFEHMSRPLEVLERIYQLLARGGTLLLRIPLVDSLAWHTYGTDWVQLDAPRHLFLHTKASIAVLASRSGFTITAIRYDASAFQFWGSDNTHGTSRCEAHARTPSVPPLPSSLRRRSPTSTAGRGS